MLQHYADYEYLLASTQLFLAMLGMGALLAPADFLSEIKKPKSLLVGIALQWCLVPLLAFTLSFILPVPAGIAIGLMMLASVPCGTLSNVLTYFGKGNIALAISLTAITTVATLVITPLLMQLMFSNYFPAEFKMPMGQITKDIVVSLISPLFLGMWIKSKISLNASERFSKWTIRFSLLLIVLMGVSAGHSGRVDPKTYGVMGIAALAVFALSAQLLSLAVSLLMKLPARDALALVIKAAFRNVSLAVAIKAIIFPAQSGQLDPIGNAVFFTVLLYGGVSLVMSIVPVLINRLLINKTSVAIK